MGLYLRAHARIHTCPRRNLRMPTQEFMHGHVLSQGVVEDSNYILLSYDFIVRWTWKIIFSWFSKPVPWSKLA